MDDHLGRDIRHDDLYEELAPITHCDFNKKVHAHSDQLSFLMGTSTLNGYGSKLSTPKMDGFPIKHDHFCGSEQVP